MSHENAPGQSPGIGHRLMEELRRYLLVSAYLFVCFGAILLYKSTILAEVGQHFVPLSAAAVKALILGKFLLIGEMAGVGSRFGSDEFLPRVARQSLLLLLVLAALTAVEEFVVALIHGRTAGEAASSLSELLRPEVFASMLLMLLILVPLVVVTELRRRLGPGGLRRLVLDH
jgi:hypothetical protein